MPRSLAEGHTKLVILTTKPVDPANPTLAELTAGIDACSNILESDFVFGAQDSEKIAEKALCAEGNSNAIGAGNYQCSFTLWRYWDAATKAADAATDTVFTAVKAKGTELWVYARLTAKKATEAFAADDELYLGAMVVTDNLQPPSEKGGYIKWHLPTEVQQAWPFIKVHA